MSQIAETEILRRVHFEEHCIEVGEWADEPSCLELRTVGTKNIDYFGSINLTMCPSFALQLGQALVAAAKEKGATSE